MIARRAWILLNNRPLRWILLLALAIRLAGLALFPQYWDFVASIAASGQAHGIVTHDTYARNWLDTGVYGLQPGVADAELPPLYSVFLALLYATVGRGYWQLGIAQSLLDLLAIALLYDLARRLCPGRNGARVAALAALFSACYPYLIFQSLTMIDTALYIAGFARPALAGFSLERCGGQRAALADAGGGAGAQRARPAAPEYHRAAALPAGLAGQRPRGLAGGLRRLAPAVLLSAALLLPWMAFGARLYGRPVFIALHGGGNFLQGNNPCTVPFLRAGYDTSWMSLDSYLPAAGVANLAAEDALFLRAGLDYLAGNPGALPELLWLKFRIYWGVDIWPPQNPPTAAQIRGAGGGLPRGRRWRLAPSRREDPLRQYDETAAARAFRLLHRWYFGALLLLALGGLALFLAGLATVFAVVGGAIQHDAGLPRLSPGNPLPRAHPTRCSSCFRRWRCAGCGSGDYGAGMIGRAPEAQQ